MDDHRDDAERDFSVSAAAALMELRQQQIYDGEEEERTDFQQNSVDGSHDQEQSDPAVSDAASDSEQSIESN